MYDARYQVFITGTCTRYVVFIHVCEHGKSVYTSDHNPLLIVLAYVPCRLTVSCCTRVSTVQLRRPQGGGLRMDARSCAPEITDDDFEAEVLSEDRPVLVFFRAPW